MNQLWGKLPVGVKFATIAIISVLVTVGIVEPGVLNFFGDSQNPELTEQVDTIQVEFNIYSKDTNDPIERAEVQFVFDGAPEPRLTNTDGYVRIEIPSRDDVDVIIKKEGFLDISRTINLDVDIDRTVIYFMDTDENYRSYNLSGDGFESGFVFDAKKSQKLTVTYIEGSFDSPVRDSPFMKMTVDQLKSGDSRYQIIESEEGDLTRAIESVNASDIKLVGTLDVAYSVSERGNQYSESISENGVFLGREIIHENNNGAWQVSLSGGIGNELEQVEINNHSRWNKIFLSYPENPVKVGDSWDLTQYILTTDGISDGTATATFSEVTEYEGEPAALIIIEGEWADKGGSNEDDSFDSILTQELGKSLVKKMAVDYAEKYVISDIKKTVVEDLFYGEFFLNPENESSSDLSDALLKVYRDADNNPDLQYYDFSEIERYVDQKFIDYAVLDILVSLTESSIEADFLADDSDEDDIFQAEGTLSGKVYRSLRDPMDLYQEVKLSGNTMGDSQPGKYEAELIVTFSR